MLSFLPRDQKILTEEMLVKAGISPPSKEKDTTGRAIIKQGEGTLQIGDVSCKVVQPTEPGLVPSNFTFVEIPQHTLVLEAMLSDFMLGEHILLIGNQGVGKNKLCDRLLQLMQREREYVQLHRDTTVQQMTLTPALRSGRLVYEDSPLVRAMTAGRILVVDEADKAAPEVVGVLKGLLEDGELHLSDGRRFVTARSGLYHTPDTSNEGATENVAGGYKGLQETKIVKVHPEFRLMALANRPGFPFLGNDFYNEMGDAFACHVIDNPDRESELALLESYAPGTDSTLLTMLVESFAELRNLADEGQISYPFSTREAVAVARHLDANPGDGVAAALDNVLAFDAYDAHLITSIHGIFQRHGISIHGNMNDTAIDINDAKVELAPPVPLPAPVQLQVAEYAPGGSLNLKWEHAQVPPFVVPKWVDVEDTTPSEPKVSAMTGIATAQGARFTEEIYGWRVPI